ncbi:hypothetical protein D3C75_1009130 [compost metagenome]
MLEQRVFHQFGDVLHGLDQIAFGERLWRLRPEVLELHAGHCAIDAFGQVGQCLWRWSFASLGRSQCLGQGAFPALLDDLLADSAQGLACAIEVGLGAVVFVIGQELRQIPRADQCVDRALLARQLVEVLRRRGGDDAVVSADLGIVPGP